MKILVINGSPKGDYSCTLQTALYLQKKFPENQFSFLNAGQKIHSFEKDFEPAKALILDSDLLLFCYPVYTFIAPSQLHRFIELMKENLSAKELEGKFATQLTTSKHFYDVTAHNFIQDNCQDLGLKFIKGLSADMDDLTTKKGQEDAIAFGKYLLWCLENDIYEPVINSYSAPKHLPVSPLAPASDVSEALLPKRKIALVADLDEKDKQLAAMIDRFSADMADYEICLTNIHDFLFKGGCISCFNCSTDGTCIYNDGFSDLLRNQIQTCSAIVLAFSIKDHSMGSIFKTYDDRQFCNGHRTVTAGKPFGYLVSGNLSEEENLRLIIEGRAQVGGNFLAGIATDEFAPDKDIDTLAKRLSYAIEEKYTQPSNFLGVGGIKIFRDLIWLMQGMMKADHRFYKENGMYDFPQRNRGRMILMYLVGALMSNPKLKAKAGSKMNEGMLAPYKKVLEED